MLSEIWNVGEEDHEGQFVPFAEKIDTLVFE